MGSRVADLLADTLDGKEEMLEEYLLDRALTTPTDIFYTYGVLYLCGTPAGGGYAEYLTPSSTIDLVDDGRDIIIAADVDLSGEEPEYLGITTRKVTPELVSKIAHSKYDASNGIDHSITHKGSTSGTGKSPEALTRYVTERLTEWATDETVQSVAAGHEDGWMVEALADLGTEIESDIASDVIARLDDEQSYKAIGTVRIKRPGDDEPQWPSEVEVLNEAMRELKLETYREKNDVRSEGEGRCFVTGREGELVGCAADPFNFYRSKQQLHAPDNNGSLSWQSRPLSPRAAMMFDLADAFLDECYQKLSSLRVYSVPYQNEIGIAEAKQLYRLLVEATRDETLESPLERLFKHIDRGDGDAANPMRLYVATVHYAHPSRWNMFGESMGATEYGVTELVNAHNQVVNSWLVSDGDHDTEPAVVPQPAFDDGYVLSEQGRSETVKAVTTGDYAVRGVGSNDDAVSDDLASDLMLSALTGEQIEVERLISAYVDELIEAESEGGETIYTYQSGYLPSPFEQFLQLSALAECGLLTTEREEMQSLTEPFRMDDKETATDGGVTAEMDPREAKLNRFLDGAPPLDDSERRSAFLTGVLIGRVSNYQTNRRDMGSTLAKNYGIRDMSTRRISQAAKEALDRLVVYSMEEDSGLFYQETVQPMVTSLATKERDEWSLSNDDVSFWYGLGVGYGLTDYSKAQADNNDDTADEAA